MSTIQKIVGIHKIKKLKQRRKKLVRVVFKELKQLDKFVGRKSNNEKQSIKVEMS